MNNPAFMSPLSEEEPKNETIYSGNSKSHLSSFINTKIQFVSDKYND